MKNLEKKALPDLSNNNPQQIKYLKLVSSELKVQDISKDLAEDVLFSLDKKLSDFATFKREEMKEGMQEIINQEFNLLDDDLRNEALKYHLDNNDYNDDFDRETGQYYYTSPTAESDMDDYVDEVVKDSYRSISVEAYKISNGSSEIL